MNDHIIIQDQYYFVTVEPLHLHETDLQKSKMGLSRLVFVDWLHCSKMMP